MTPLIFVTAGVILVFTPLSVLGSIFLWQLYRQELLRLPEESAKQFALTLAVLSISRTIAALLLVIPTVLFLIGISVPWSGQLILVSLDILLITNVVVAGYLWWLRRA